MAFEYHRILVAVDGSDASELAFKKAVDIVLRNNAKLFLVHVIDTRTITTVAPEVYDQTLAARSENYAQTLLQEYKTKASKNGVANIETHVEIGSPKIKIPKDLAKKFDADLIICGATGMNAVERFLIGSVSESITRYAKCDVLVVRS
ncbi:Nucleotide-binding universal stress protein, UspA family [Gracilibacillus ureilyticus]|uniref:Universal stress protein n=1 Tax=Gracilibacillus ureilyticus TaxID=531814 RepID=A0A1H9UDQ4_9BACI|nr:universal stress protein [Gracilibacillus ureilyticus]SES07297.1 Nucleotide-binding universal stress protein, UspA family [Gracilibacillus ureilyticus]